MTVGTFALIEILQNQKTWISAYDDDDFCLRFKWSSPAKLSPQSCVTIEWRIPQSAVSGVYWIRHFGAASLGIAGPAFFCAFLIVLGYTSVNESEVS